ncbi:MAG: type II toxin-antitoxin system MqsA family antitoxin [Thiobacillus sp.]
MNCPICKHGTLRPGFASATFEPNGAVLVCKDVPADICDNGGEVFHREDITRALLSQAEAVLKQGVEVGIRHFAQAV